MSPSDARVLGCSERKKGDAFRRGCHEATPLQRAPPLTEAALLSARCLIPCQSLSTACIVPSFPGPLSSSTLPYKTLTWRPQSQLMGMTCPRLGSCPTSWNLKRCIPQCTVSRSSTCASTQQEQQTHRHQGAQHNAPLQQGKVLADAVPGPLGEGHKLHAQQGQSLSIEQGC